MANNKPYANNEPKNHDLNNSAPTIFAGSNETSSFFQKPLSSSCKLNIIERNHIWGSHY